MKKYRSLQDAANDSQGTEESSAFKYLKYGSVIVAFGLFIYFAFANLEFVKSLATGYGLFGLFVAAIIANATVLLPLPIDVIFLVISGDSPLIDGLIIAVVLGAGAGIGEMTAYIAGLVGMKAIEEARKTEFEKIKIIREKISSLGMYFIYFSALVPFPFDIIGITAGAIKYDPKKFFIAALAGKTTRYIIIAIASHYGFGLIKGFFNLP